VHHFKAVVAHQVVCDQYRRGAKAKGKVQPKHIIIVTMGNNKERSGTVGIILV